MFDALKKGSLKKAGALKEEHGFSTEEYGEMVRAAILDQVAGLNLMDLEDMLEVLGEENREAFIRSPEMKEAATQGMVAGLAGARMEAVLQIIEDLRIPTETLKSEELQAAAKHGAQLMLEHGSVGGMKKIAAAFNLPEGYIQPDELLEAAKKGAAHLRELNREPLAIALENEFNIF